MSKMGGETMPREERREGREERREQKREQKDADMDEAIALQLY